jgi:hypothetical protein
MFTEWHIPMSSQRTRSSLLGWVWAAAREIAVTTRNVTAEIRVMGLLSK